MLKQVDYMKPLWLVGASTVLVAAYAWVSLRIFSGRDTRFGSGGLTPECGRVEK